MALTVGFKAGNESRDGYLGGQFPGVQQLIEVRDVRVVLGACDAVSYVGNGDEHRARRLVDCGARDPAQHDNAY